MPKNLLIVESPAKAKTIEKYLGKDFKVKSSYGHIRDLAKGSKGVDIDNGFEPKYEVSPDKKKVVSELKKSLKQAEEIWLATDEDREGEAISWHLCKVLGLDEKSTKRIVFREITKSAIQKAIQKPRLVDVNLVDAQQARRILDRLVGFELSEVLWRKVRNKLSAGRVQSVAVKLIVEKEEEIQAFEIQDFFKVYAFFEIEHKNGKRASLRAELPKKLPTLSEAKDFLERAKSASYTVKNIEVKPTKRRPTAPFTTSTLQQEAARKLYFGVQRTMSVAQRLYEQGHITYMRTDSTNLSNTAIGAISQEIKSEFGEKYLKTRQYKSKNSSAQEAHEAIRPTNVSVQNVSGDRDMQRLYELIWKRTIASQMADAELEKTTVDIGISSIPNEVLQAKGEVLKFDGFLKVYMESNDDDEEEDLKGILPPLKVGQELLFQKMESIQRFTKPPARYTEASLVKKLEELNIGRPSTYAPTITKIMDPSRGYVTKESREGKERNYTVMTLRDGKIISEDRSEITGATSNRLYSSDVGMVVTRFLDEHFGDIMNYGFTADIEERFDKIAEGNMDWRKMLKEFYAPFHENIVDTKENAERANGTRVLGTDPESGHTVMVTLTRYGPAIRIGTNEEIGEEGKPRFASLQPGQSMESISFEEAMDLFKLPKTVGEYEGKPVIIGTGRYGPYVKYDEKFISIGRKTDPMSVSIEQAVELIEKKREEDRPIAFHDGEPITKGIGRFGPYVKWKNLYANVSKKKYDFDTLSPDDAIELMKAKIEKEANRYIQVWEDEKLSIENGRWGPFIRFKKKSIKLPKGADGKRMQAEEAKELTLDQVKALVEAEIPGAFKKKKTTKRKKSTSKSKSVKKS